MMQMFKYPHGEGGIPTTVQLFAAFITLPFPPLLYRFAPRLTGRQTHTGTRGYGYGD